MIEGVLSSAMRGEDEEAIPLAGYASGDRISFSANIGNEGSVTTWSGLHVGSGKFAKLVTEWHLL